MTTFIAFQPNGQQPFTFQADIGDTSLFGTVLWNHYASRYYLQLTNGAGNTVVYVPLIASPDNHDINLALPYAPGKLIFRDSSQQFEVN